MKKLSSLLLIALLAMPVVAQTAHQSNLLAPVEYAQAGNPPPTTVSVIPPLFGNLPPYQTNTTLFLSGKLEFRVAAATGPAYTAINSLTYFVTQGFGVTADASNGGVNNLNSFHLGGEYAYPVQGVRFTGRATVGMSLVTHRPEGQLSLFLSYVPLNAAPNVFMFGGPQITLDKTSFQRNSSISAGLFGGVGYRF
mgnify:CR=1 FL=1